MGVIAPSIPPLYSNYLKDADLVVFPFCLHLSAAIASNIAARFRTVPGNGYQ